MINSIFSSKETFNTVVFKEGLNIITAEKSMKSSDKDSRNGLGKTTLIEIIHFCLGSDLTKKNKLNAPELQDWDFSIDFSVKEQRIIAKRYIADPKKIFIIMDDPSFFKFKEDVETKEKYIDIEIWKDFLGKNLFNIMDIQKSYQPSFRGILNFFIRRAGGYADAFITVPKESAVTTIVNNAFLLGLKWEKSLDLVDVNSRIKKLNHLKEASDTSKETKGRLKSYIITTESAVEETKKNLDNFNVLPEYQNMEQEADTLTKSIQKLTNTNIIAKRKLDNYLDSVKSESISDIDNLELLYKEANIVFGEVIKKNLEEAKKFHINLIKNRKDFLETEIGLLETAIEANGEQVKELSNKRQNIMNILSSHGALDEYNLLQEEWIKKSELLEKAKTRLKELDELTKNIRKLKKNKENIRIELENSLNTDDSIVNNIKIFDNNSMSLYSRSGNLIIDISPKTGNYKFEIQIEKGTSEGITKMMVFCYDLMLIETFRQDTSCAIDFLIHDSTIFDAVDERQKAKAIELAHKKAIDKGFQYIFTINSDQLPYGDFTENFKCEEHIIKRLTDDDISNSILGIMVSNPSSDMEDE